MKYELDFLFYFFFIMRFIANYVVAKFRPFFRVTEERNGEVDTVDEFLNNENYLDYFYERWSNEEDLYRVFFNQEDLTLPYAFFELHVINAADGESTESYYEFYFSYNQQLKETISNGHPETVTEDNVANMLETYLSNKFAHYHQGNEPQWIRSVNPIPLSTPEELARRRWVLMLMMFENVMGVSQEFPRV